ncbi:MAG: glycosyltransferase family 2 protein [Janthinobacterium lividum]
MVKLLQSFAVVISGLLAVALMVISYDKMAAAASSFAYLERSNLFMKVPTLYFMTFIALLVIRYMVLILFSFVEHVDYLRRFGTHASPIEETSALTLPGGAEPLVTLVVPAYNEGIVIQTALKSLIELDYPNFEIIVVDDGSSDDTYMRALEFVDESHKVPIRVLTKPNGGKSDALNVGLAYARGEFVLNMDGDAKLSRNTIRACIRHFDDPRIGAVAGNVKVANRENALTRVQALEYVEGLAMARKAQSLVRAVNIIPGPLGMFRRTALIGAGGYDHDTFAEDCDLTLKLLLQGWSIVYEPSAIAWCETPSKLLNLLKQRYRWTRGILQAISKHKGTLLHPRSAPVNCFILWYMLFEAIVWPVSNVGANIFFAALGVRYGIASFLFFWWIELTLLDVIAAAYCVVIEKEDPRLIPYAVLFRTFYILVVDVSKVFATVEELLKLKMTWGKLQREGKL